MHRQSINNKITISFTKSDDDLIKYLEELKKRNKASEFIRDAIREKIERIEMKESGTEINHEANKEIMKELDAIIKRVNFIEKEKESKKEHYKESYSENLVVSKEDRFGTSMKREEPQEEIKEIPKEEVKEENNNNELEDALDFFSF